MNLSFHRTATKLYLPTLTSLILTLTERGIARLGTWQLYSCLRSYFAVGTVLMHLNEKLCVLVQICSESQEVAGMTPIAASRVQAMAGIFHPFVSLCFHCIFVPRHLASRSLYLLKVTILLCQIVRSGPII